MSARHLTRILAVVPGDHVAGLRLRALILAYLLTGRRRQEVLRLRWRDLDLEGSFYRYQGKGSKERQRVLPGPVRAAIEAYARASGAERLPDDAVCRGRWRDQPVDGKYPRFRLGGCHADRGDMERFLSLARILAVS